MLIAMLVIVGVLLRSATVSLLILLLATMSALVSLGALGWTGIPINSATAVAPLMVITLAVASSVHVLSSIRQTMQKTADHFPIWAGHAITDHAAWHLCGGVYYRKRFRSSLNFSISPPFRQLGNMVASSMIGVWVFTIFFSWVDLLATHKNRIEGRRQLTELWLRLVNS